MNKKGVDLVCGEFVVRRYIFVHIPATNLFCLKKPFLLECGLSCKLKLDIILLLLLLMLDLE